MQQQHLHVHVMSTLCNTHILCASSMQQVLCIRVIALALGLLLLRHALYNDAVPSNVIKAVQSR